MSEGISFETDSNKYAKTPGSPGGGYEIPSNESKMAQWFMKKGIAKTPSAANGVLVGVVILNIIIVYLVISYFL